MISLYDVQAPAKLNLFLHVTGRRADGYHLLQSVFVMIDWCDTLHFTLRHDGGISRQDLTETLPPDDLITRAARALQQRTGCPFGAEIEIEKHIPAQAGMGGGSSDAAACLLALNRLWKLKLSTRQLAQIGLSLGADVPFFLAGQNAWVEGIGERITPVHIPATRFVVVKPVEGVDTSAIFSSPELKRDSKPATISGFAADPFSFGCNDLQPVATKHCPDVARALDWLGASGLPGRMTGSGSAVFAQLLDGVDLDGAPEAWRIRTCSTLEAHPLRGWASSDG